ncbi:MAG: NADH-quinone oxidoreductase subunit N [Acidobacteriota bacterium]
MPEAAIVNIDWAMAAPLLILTATACLILLACALPAARGTGSRRGFVLSLVGLVAALVATGRLADTSRQMSTLGGMLVMDRAALFMIHIVLAAAILAVLLSAQFLERSPIPAGEYHALLLFAALGMVIMAATNNLLVLFLGLEVFSVALYILAGIARDWLRCIEASMKYFLLGAFSTGFILYGMAFLYGATGSLDMMEIGRALTPVTGGVLPGNTLLVLAGCGLMIIGLVFKVGAVPFHWWVPDVYEGTPTPVTAFMAVGTKGVAFVALIRLVTVAFGDVLVWRWTVVLGVLALMSMAVGNIVALTQRNVKRMLAYSSVAHAGYLLVAVACGSDLGTGALLFYFASYLLTTLGAFGVVSLVAETGPDGDEGMGLLRFTGLGRRNPMLAFAMAVFMLSLTGVPPTSGFVGKYFIFQAAMQRALQPGGGLFMILALAGMLLSVVSAAYYLRVVVAMYMQEPDGAPVEVRPKMAAALAIGLTVAGILALGLYPTPIYDLTHNIHSALQALAAVLAGQGAW